MKTTEVMTYPVRDDGRGLFVPESFDDIASFAHDKDVIVMGPGLSQNDGVTKLVRKIYTEIDKPFVIDADGINAFQGFTDILKNTQRQAVLTPHPGELARLVGKTPREVNADRVNIARTLASEWGINILLKGAASVLAASDGGIFLNPTETLRWPKAEAATS